MLYDLVRAEYLENYLVKVKFEDGKEGVVDFQDYAKSGGIFDLLKDISYFKKFRINGDIGTICWPNGADVAPETLYAKIQRR